MDTYTPSAKDIIGSSPLLAITIILVGLKPGSHKVLIELADPTHKAIASETMTFTLPGFKR